MKRDMDLIRTILMKIEAEEGLEGIQDYHPKEVTYHAALAIEAGLLSGEIIQDETGDTVLVSIRRPTWAGHEFLDASRNPKIYQEAKNEALKAGIAFSFELGKSLLLAIGRQHVPLLATGSTA